MALVTGVLFRGVIVPTSIQLLLLVMGIMADLILEGIGPSLVASSLGARSLTPEIKHVTSLALPRKPLLEALVGVFCSISLAFDT